jgi:hypothetical protein
MSEYAGKQSRGPGSSSSASALEPQIGKRTLVEQAYPVAPAPIAPGSFSGAVVQRRGTGIQPSGPADVHAAAARGTQGPATALPFADRIQSAFGPHHDVGAIQAHVGGPAAEAASAMGASAYATGNRAVFASAPDLHTAAHEAAHVVQQAQGVHLYGGVGQAGDHYERHADAVADRVVAGQSAADLLPASAPGAAVTHGAGAAIQRQPATDVAPVNWGEHTIKADAVAGHSVAGASQAKVMANLQKMLKLKAADPTSGLDDGEMQSFAKDYALDEQCFGYTEIFKQFPVWLKQVWDAVVAWNATDLNSLRTQLAAVNPRRTSGDVLDEAMLLMREGFENQGGEDAPDGVPTPTVVSTERDMSSIGGATGTMKGAKDLGDRMRQAFARVPATVNRASMEISSGGHSTRCEVARAPFSIIAFDPDNVGGFQQTTDWQQASAFLWQGLSHRRDGQVRGTASIDIDVQVEDTERDNAGLGDDESVLGELSGELLTVTIADGLPDDLLHVLNYNDSSAELIIDAIENGSLPLTKFNAMMAGTGAGGETWTDIAEKRGDEWTGRVDTAIDTSTASTARKLAVYKELKTKALIKQEKCTKELSRIAKLKPEGEHEGKRLATRANVFGKKRDGAARDIAIYNGKLAAATKESQASTSIRARQAEAAQSVAQDNDSGED